MASFTSQTYNYSVYTIPAAWILSLVPHIYATQLAASKFDNTQPRGLIETIKNDQSIDQKTKGRILRAESAQQNGFENVGLFAAAVMAGNLAHLAPSTLNLLSGGYLASRVLYNILYITNETPAAANTRSVVFVGGVVTIMTLFIKAGNALATAGLRL